jgi:hypothetical protein
MEQVSVSEPELVFRDADWRSNRASPVAALL